MANSPYPLPTSKRQTENLVGTGALKYGPFGEGWGIFDVDDIVVETRPLLGASWVKVAVTVTKTLATARYSPFYITFPTAILADTVFRVRGKRKPARALAVTRGGVIDGIQLEEELSKTVVVQQETLRDLDNITPPEPRANGVMAFDADGKPILLAAPPALTMADGLVGQIRREAGGTVWRIEDGDYGDIRIDGNVFRVKNQLYVVTRATGFATINPNEHPIVWLDDGEGSGAFKWKSYDATADAALDPFQAIIAKGTPALTTGAYVRQVDGDSLYSAMFGAVGDVNTGNASPNGTDNAARLNSMADWCVKLRKTWVLSPPSGEGYRINSPIKGRAYMNMSGPNSRWCQLFPVGDITALGWGSDPTNGVVGAEDFYHNVIGGFTINGKYLTGAGRAIALAGASGVTQKHGRFENMWITGCRTTRWAFEIVGNAYQIALDGIHFLDNDMHFKAHDDGAGGFPVGIDLWRIVAEGGGDVSNAAFSFRNCTSISAKQIRLQSNKNLYTVMVWANANVQTFNSSDFEDIYFENNTKNGAGAYKSGAIEFYAFGSNALLSGVNLLRSEFHTSAANMMWFDGVEKCRVEGNTGGDASTCPLRTTGVQGPGNYYDAALMEGTPVMGAGSALRYLTGSANYDPPSLATNATATTNVTVTGAVVGDYVEYVRHSAAPAGIRCTGAITGADTVQVTITNATAANPTDVANGTINVRVRKA